MLPVQYFIFLNRFLINGLGLCWLIEILIFMFIGSKWLNPLWVWQICLLGIVLDAASAIFHLFEAFFDF